MPYARLEPWQPGAFAAEAPMLLPEGMMGRTWRLPPLAVYHGLCPLWDEGPRLPVMAPISTLIELRVDREWGAQMMATPRSVGVGASANTLTEVAWAVLCRMPREMAVRLLAPLSCLVDRYRDDPMFLTPLLRLMQTPAAIRGRLLAEARSGTPLLHPRGVRWVLCELLAASDEERDRLARWNPNGHDDASLVARAWFRSLRGDQYPGPDEVLLATWMLQDAFRGADVSVESADRALAAVTSMGFRFAKAGGWWPMLDRALTMWTVPDLHPVIRDSALTPSALRAVYSQRLGVPVEQWLAGNWALCLRWWLAMESPSHPVTSEPAELFRFPMESSPNVFSESFTVAFRQHSVAPLAEFVAAIRRDVGADYAGLGTLPQSDSLACRNHPVVELPGGNLIPLSVELVAERATSLHRLLLGARGRPSTAFGRIFEAHVSDQLDRLRPRHLVVTEAEITGVLGQTARCDALVMSGHRDYLAVETSVQGLSRKVAAGDVASIRTMAERYQEEADQAVATIGHLPAIVADLGLPTPTSATHLVVSETPVPHSPAFLAELRNLRPERTQKFVCGVAELELLVELGIRGWGVPTAIATWQAKPEAVPLEAQLLHMMEILSPHFEPESEPIDRWIHRLPVREGEAAA